MTLYFVMYVDDVKVGGGSDGLADATLERVEAAYKKVFERELLKGSTLRVEEAVGEDLCDIRGRHRWETAGLTNIGCCADCDLERMIADA